MHFHHVIGITTRKVLQIIMVLTFPSVQASSSQEINVAGVQSLLHSTVRWITSEYIISYNR